MSEPLCNNPLLNQRDLVPFSQIRPEHILPAVEHALANATEARERLLNSTFTAPNTIDLTFENTLYPLIELSITLRRVWAPVENLLSFQGTAELRQAAEQARPLVVGFINDLMLDSRLYQKITAYATSIEGRSLIGERARHLSLTLRDLRLAGADLSDKDKGELREINLKHAELAHRFADNCTDSKFELILTSDEELAGLPGEVVSAARRRAIVFRENCGGDAVPEGAALFNLDYPSYLPFMRFSSRGDLRKTLAFNYLQRGTSNATRGLLEQKESSSKSLDNNVLISQILELAHRKAQLLGFSHFAQLSTKTKMAQTPERVIAFLARLGERIKPIALKERDALISFQKQIGYLNSEQNIEKLCTWDREYLSERFRQTRHNFDSQAAKPYFELRQTLTGIFNIAQILFDISFKRIENVDAWHSDVEVYQVGRTAGEKLGILYLDLYPRDSKHQGAWVSPLSSSYKDANGAIHHSETILSCNLTPPTPEQPSLLSFEETTTLFHEFGHALHNILSTVELEPLAGLNVPFDFVELPSQLFENFCTEAASLRTFAKHYKSGEVIPEELLGKLLKTRHLFAGLQAQRQLEFALFDMEIYGQADSASAAIDINDAFRSVIERYGVLDYWQGTNFPCGFQHIFAGSYAAGYYSYKWSEVLEADAFSIFKSAGVLSAKVGAEFRDKILARGDSEEALQLFINFMGREANEDALLEKLRDTL